MKTMMKKTTQYWGVSTKFFDSGKVKANIFPVEAATKPESMKEENLMCDEYRDFFDTFEEAADCDRVVIENPTPSKIFDYPAPTQAVQPCEYGHPYTKKTLLWERGVPPLKPTNVVTPTRTWCPSGSYTRGHEDRYRGEFTTDRARNRAKTFPGIAAAMAEQWGGDIR